MIIDIVEAKQIDPNIAQEDLDAFETAIRKTTHNKFQNTDIRFKGIKFISEDEIQVQDGFIPIKSGDTVEVNYSSYNDGLFVVNEVVGNVIKVKQGQFYEVSKGSAMLTKIEYPLDIKKGVKKLIKYDLKMGNKIGIKSETISRMSTTYFDSTANESADGYPKMLLDFLTKYQKMRI